jgi:hypothetical protein
MFLAPVLDYFRRKWYLYLLGTCKANGNVFGAGKAGGVGIWFWHLFYIINEENGTCTYLVPVKRMEMFLVPVKRVGVGIWFWHLFYIIYRRKWYLHLAPVKRMKMFVLLVKRVVLVYVCGTCYILLYRIKWCLQGGGVK